MVEAGGSVLQHSQNASFSERSIPRTPHSQNPTISERNLAGSWFMNEISNVNLYFAQLSRTVEALPFSAIEQVVELLLRAYEASATIYLFGNGGSASLASHLACDLGKGTAIPLDHPPLSLVPAPGGAFLKRFRAMALTDSIPLLTAWANDSHYQNIFAEQLLNFVQPADVAFAISGSGNSPNVLHALKVARRAGAFTVGLTGFAGGQMKDLCDACVIIPSDNMQIIEDLHLCVAHSLFTVLRHKMAAGQAALPLPAPEPIRGRRPVAHEPAFPAAAAARASH
jgi:D-sedoheptulose 7-phosphate isomerase